MNFETIIEGYSDEIVRKVQDLIRIKSIKGEPEAGMPCGKGPYEALQYTLSLCKDMGFRTKDLDGYVGYAELGEGEETIGVLVHLDVVPEGQGWTYPPFSAELHDGKIYGRGAIDDKGPVIAILYAMKTLITSEVKLKRKIRVVFGTDEENGFDGINYYRTKEKPFDMGFTPDASFPLIRGEKGILLCKLKSEIHKRSKSNIYIKSIIGGSAPNMVPGSCNAIISIEKTELPMLEALIDEFKQCNGYEIALDVMGNIINLSCNGKTAHGSTPEEGLNAISIMMLFLNRFYGANDDVARFIKIYNDKIGMQYNGEAMNPSYYDDMSGKMTLNVGKIALDEHKLDITIDIRYPISFSADDIIQTLRNEFAVEGFAIEQLFAVDPIFFHEDHPLLQKLLKVYKDVTKDQESKPLVTGGATYARSMENVIAFGPVFSDEPELAHKGDEYITIEKLLLLTKIYTYALYELAK
jgi:succinyl-diaminopimelate desuccinylase